MLRDYQQSAHDAVVSHIRASLQPVVVDAATGSGKSHIIAALADTMHTLSGGKGILCLAPSRELILQNHEKYLATGNPASIYSASAGEKCLQHPVVFGTPLTVLNNIEKFSGRISTLVIDEAHGLTPSMETIIRKLREGNQYLRVVGLTATPYRLGQGYIYLQGPDGRVHGEDVAKAPFFAKCVYRVHARELIDQGFLTRPTIGDTGDTYDTSGLELKGQKFTSESVERAFEGHGRLTSKIIAEVVEKARNRRGVMIFASTVEHARECLASLPQENSAIVTGATKQSERAELLRRFKSQELKYLVNVSVLTTGFDAPHVDLIAVLRPTESVGLFQQIVGRGLRVSEGKADCLILDYAENLRRLCPDGDIFNPLIRAIPDSDGALVDVKCPTCGTVNEFKLSREGRSYDLDENGYCVDLQGQQIMTDYGPLPGHHGRRCQYKNNRDVQCSYRWTPKICRKCGHENDIAARKCQKCSAELVNPNKKLSFGPGAKDPHELQTERVLNVNTKPYKAKSGAKCIIAIFETPTKSFRVFFQPYSAYTKVQNKYLAFHSACRNGTPAEITYRKNDKGYYDILEYR